MSLIDPIVISPAVGLAAREFIVGLSLAALALAVFLNQGTANIGDDSGKMDAERVKDAA